LGDGPIEGGGTNTVPYRPVSGSTSHWAGMVVD
jgi:hypothetical protein